MKASAPGKLFLLGEYAVLEGAPAALVPVPQHALVDIRPGSGDVSSLSVDHQKLPFSDAIEHFGLLGAIATELDCREQLARSHVTLDTRDFHRDGSKLGLGSSAALTAALVMALMPDADRQAQWQAADAAHRRFQGGEGSGADVALSVWQTPMVFRRGATPSSLTLPEDLHMLAIWTGSAASTTDYVGRVRTWAVRQPAQLSRPDPWQQQVQQLTDIADAFVAACDDNNIGQVLATIDQYGRQLRRLSSESGANFYSDAHVALQKKVESARCVYKPSGAGGGDFGIAFGDDKHALNTLRDVMHEEERYTFFLSRVAQDH